MPLKKFTENIQVYFTLIGLLFLIPSAGYSLLQLARFPFIRQSLSLTYAGLLIIPLGLFLLLLGTYKKRLLERREVAAEEINTLFSEAEYFIHTGDDSCLKDVKNEMQKLSDLKRTTFELDVLPLRQKLVKFYNKEFLASKTRYELNLFKEYAEDDDPNLYEEIKKRIEDIIRKIEDQSNEKINDSSNLSSAIEKLRSELITLMEAVAYYDKTWAEGEVIFKRVLYWAAGTAFIALLIGLLPIVHTLGEKQLSILHWAALGVAGSLLSVLAGIHDPSIPELGETKGREVLQRTIIGIVIGGMASVLLYAALSGELLAGKIFPEIPIAIDDEMFWVNTGASIFWGIAAGFSLRIFASLTGIAESAFGRDESE